MLAASTTTNGLAASTTGGGGVSSGAGTPGSGKSPASSTVASSGFETNVQTVKLIGVSGGRLSAAALGGAQVTVGVSAHTFTGSVQVAITKPSLAGLTSLLHRLGFPSYSVTTGFTVLVSHRNGKLVTSGFGHPVTITIRGSKVGSRGQKVLALTSKTAPCVVSEAPRSGQVVVLIRKSCALMLASPNKHPAHDLPAAAVTRFLWLWLAVAGALAIGGAAARADNGVIVGVSDDSFLWNPVGSAQIARDLGITAFRVTLKWDGTSRTLSDGDAKTIAATVAATSGLRMVVAIVGENADLAPQTDAQRDAYCSYATDLVQRFPSIRDVVIWNEVNLSYFWRPQFDGSGASAAPAAYEALLAHCWDELHAAAPDVNVIADTHPRGNDNPNARSNISHSPLNFIARLGSAIAGADARDRSSTRSASIRTRAVRLPVAAARRLERDSQGDLPRLLAGLDAAFAGTGQKAPGSCKGELPTVWYLEAGYQTGRMRTRRGSTPGSRPSRPRSPDRDGTGANGNGPDQACRSVTGSASPTASRRRRLLQLHAPGRGGSRRVAVGRALGRRDAEGVVLGAEGGHGEGGGGPGRLQPHRRRHHAHRLDLYLRSG